jgi:rhodanese-related sulfurtransferase
MKPCGTCKETSQDNQVFGVFPQKLDKIVKAHLPSSIHVHHKNQGQKFKIHHGVPNQYFFYFGSQPRNPTSRLLKKDAAYGDLSNSGIAKFDQKGTAIVYLDCPQVYIYEDGKVYHRHFHFVYWDNTKWSNELYTSPILCIVDKSFIQQWIQNIILINALSAEDFLKKNIPGSRNLPYNELWSEKQIKISNKNSPLVVYCQNPKCNAGLSVCNRLALFGFYNLFLYEGGIDDWLA